MDLALADNVDGVQIGTGTPDPNTGASDLAVVICGPGTNHFEAQVRDRSNPEPGLMVNLHVVKGAEMKTIADTVSGDTGEGSYTPFLRIKGGPGEYYIAVTTTKPGIRLFDLIYHCKASDDTHTDTDISVLQID